MNIYSKANKMPKENNRDHSPPINHDSFHTLDLPNFGEIQVFPFLNVGTIISIEKAISRQPSPSELVDIVFAERAKIKDSDGNIRAVTKDEVKSLTTEDRTVFSQGFLKAIRGDIEKNQDTDLPIEELAAYAVAEWKAAQESAKEIADMVRAGFSEKTINLFKESQTLAERVAGANKLPHFSEIEKFHPTINSAVTEATKKYKNLESPAIRAALQMGQTPSWKAMKDFYESSSIKSLQQTLAGQSSTLGEMLGHPRSVGYSSTREKIERLTENKIITPPPLTNIRTGASIINEQFSLLKTDLGDRMQRIGDSAADIALQQSATNSMIMSALSDMRNKWKEDEKNNRTTLLFAALSLAVSAVLTLIGVIQDYQNNKDSEKYQEQTIKLMENQNEIAERQRLLLDQLAKSKESMTDQQNGKTKGMSALSTSAK